MSLFRVKELWTTDIGGDEEFAEGSLCVDALDGHRVLVFVGSLNGILRVFRPRLSNFQSDDRLLVIDTQQPIIQLESGYFSSGALKSVAVLHPASLRILFVDFAGGAVSQRQLQLIQFPRSIANMTSGRFGSKRSIDGICVQSLDGEIYIVHGERMITLGRCWDQNLIAGPVLYVAEIESFVTATASFELVCYSYELMREHETITSSVALQDALPPVASKWILELGEIVFALSLYQLETPWNGESRSAIVCLGERTLFYVSLEGQLLLHKRLDFAPASITVYRIPTSQPSPLQTHALITSRNGSWMIFKGTKIIWAAKSESVPVAVRIAKVDNLEGTICALDEKGHLAACCLGTRPRWKLQLPNEVARVDHAQLNAEYKEIKQKLQEDLSRKNARMESSGIVLRISFLETRTDATEFGFGRQKEVEGWEGMDVSLKIVCLAPSFVNDCDLLIVPPSGIIVDEDCWTVPTIESGEENAVSIPLRFSRAEEGEIDGRCLAIVMYTDIKGAHRVHEQFVDLPIALFYKLVPPIKEAEYKFVIETAATSICLKKLFADVVEAQRYRHALDSTVLTFDSRSGTGSGSYVTIVASKSSSRYRIQSNCLPTIGALLLELEKRIRAFLEHDGGCDDTRRRCVWIKDDPVLEPYFQVIELHFLQRQKVLTLETDLEKAAVLYRAVQKRLISNYKEAQPSSVDHLNRLLTRTLQKATQLADEMEEGLHELRHLSGKLRATTRLFINLIRLRLDLSSEDVELLENLLSVDATDELDSGWEESVQRGIHWALQECFGVRLHAEASKGLQLDFNLRLLQEQMSDFFKRLMKSGRLRKIENA